MSSMEKAALVIADAIETEGGNPALHIDLGCMTDAIAQALADAGLLMPEDEELAGLRCEYRVIHPTPRTMVPRQPLHSEAEADKIIASARHFLGNTFADQLIIQRRLSGEWEEM